MVGFPGETEADFEDTLGVLEDTPLFYAHVFKYSERAGTATARMQERSDPRVSNARGARLRKASAEKTAGFCAALAGTAQPVLFEQAEHGFWTGYTPNFVRVAARSNEDLENEVRLVRLGDLQGDLVYGDLI
jgi:threonylcarbamoyladenosine tRNA methylthiotransferase MtaB